MKHLILCSILFHLCLSVVQFTPTLLHKLQRVGAPILSTDKRYVVFPVTQWEEEQGTSSVNLRYVAVDEVSSNPRNLTTFKTGQSDSVPCFSEAFPGYIFFMRSAEGQKHVYYMKFDPDAQTHPEPKQLTSLPITVSNLLIKDTKMLVSADVFLDCGNDLQCTANKLEEIKNRTANTYYEYTKLMVRHWDFWYKEGFNVHPLLFNLKLNEDGTTIEVVDSEPTDLLLAKSIVSPPIENGREMFDISNNGRYIAFTSHVNDEKMSYTTKWDINLYDTTTQEVKVITLESDGFVGRCEYPKFSDDSTKLAFLCMKRAGLENDQLHLKVYDIVNAQYITPSPLEVEFKPTINDFAWYDQDKLVFVYSVLEAGHTKLYYYYYIEDSTVGATYVALTDDDVGYGSPLVVDVDTFVTKVVSFTFPDCIGLITKDAATGIFTNKLIANPNEETLTNYEIVKPESYNFTGVNNDTIQGWIFKPVNFQEGKKYPLAFLIHGGPESAYKPSWSYGWNAHMWTNRGYALSMINPHGSQGMGIEFQDAVRYGWGGAPFEDIMLGFDFLNKTYSSWIDFDRVGACGASYGGFMINWIQGNNDDKKFKALVTHDGVFSTITMFYATEELWFPMSEYCKHDDFGCTPFDSEESRRGYEMYNPESRVDHWNTPHLIIHGTLDYRIPITEGISAFTALQLRGVPSRFLHFPDENHWVLKPENSIKWFHEVLDWLDKYLDNY